MTWLDDWLAGVVDPRRRADPVERSRHERFLVARSASTLVAMMALPPYLLGHDLPSVLEGLALLALAMPLPALAVLLRTGRLEWAQILVSVGLALFTAAAAASFGGLFSPALLALAIVPLDALFCGSRRSAAAALAAALAAVPLVVLFEARPIGPAEDLTALLVVALILGFGHAAAQAVLDRRLVETLRRARSAGDAREGSALQAIDDLVTWHDRHGSVLRANAAAARLVRVPAATLQGRGLFDRIHVADRPAYLKAVSDAAVSPEPVAAILRLRLGDEAEPVYGPGPAPVAASRAEPRTIWVELRAHRLASAEDDRCAVVAVTRDISQHRRRTEDLELLCRRAEEAAANRAQLLASVSRELEAPLKAVVASSELMTGREAATRSASCQDYARIVLESGRQMLGVVSTLHELSAIQAGQDNLVPEPLDVAALVGESCGAVRTAAERAGVALAQEVAPDLPRLRVDRRACRQILLGLLAECVSAAPRGALITVQARREGERMVFAVREAGAPAARPRLAAALPCAAAGRRWGATGSGLGLAVVRDLVALHGGRIDLSGAPGEGPCATVSLPIEAGRRTRAKPPTRLHSHRRSSDGALAIKTG